MYYTPETLLNHVFEDLRKTKAPNTKIAERELENEKFKFARSMLYNRRRPSIKDSVGFQIGGKEYTEANANGKKFPRFVKDKGPIVHDNDAYIIYPKNYHTKKTHAKNVHHSHTIVHHAHIYRKEASHSRHTISHAKLINCPRRKKDCIN
jgi:hypothetical protein